MSISTQKYKTSGNKPNKNDQRLPQNKEISKTLLRQPEHIDIYGVGGGKWGEGGQEGEESTRLKNVKMSILSKLTCRH